MTLLEIDTATFALVCLEIMLIIFLAVIAYVGFLEKGRQRSNLLYLLKEGKLLQEFMQSKAGKDLLEQVVQQSETDEDEEK